MKLRSQSLLALLLVMSLISCNSGGKSDEKETHETSASPKLKEETINYKADTINAVGYIVYNENSKDKRPAVLIVHEWWGLNDYAKKRARQLAEMGYVAMAVDMFGDGKTADDPKGAMALAGPFYQNVQLTKTRLDAAMNKLKEYPQVDTGKIAAIGYCYGGFVVLNAAKQGADLKGVVSFHGNLSGAPASKDLLKAKILVFHGAADPLVPNTEVAAFRKSMDSISADYTFKAYDSAMHAFTNPEATEKGKKFNIPVAYNAAADKQSWVDMKSFFERIFK